MAAMDFADLASAKRVVIDNGSGIIKAGMAGESHPSVICSSFVGRPKHTRVMTGGLEGDVFMGKKAQEHRGLLSIKYPMEHGIVEDWKDMDRIWNYVYSKEGLGVQPDEHPVLLTEAPLNPKKNREKAAEVLFESLNVPALFVSMQAVLALYASGRTTGAVLDSGDGVTHAVPVYQGFAVKHAITRVDVAGRDVTRHLQTLLRREGALFKTTAEFEIVRTIKEAKGVCFVSTNAKKDESMDDRSIAAKYRLPDMKEITIHHARFRAPEILFDPSIIGDESEGVHKVLHYAIQKSDMDLRRDLYSNIIVSGGSTLFDNFCDRLLNELKALGPKDCKIKIIAPPERKYSTWLGGSILASLDTFRTIWTEKREYEEEGARILHSKSFL
ncbi:uncharacterized protein MONBRDRAFT_35236 [Monosiga brevicollis MX1]|uniref:Uncharacterized protein n=1 Tax=Monosiga brevicollis TaxID=81824 RepID=A9V5L4_MONBE|nr:uncharacterized protein MONBRDRAFT_35236 [Monosiga brevicollis MX1]EDQ87060.1 predicted protein [Monosiga brevicollis MX1]|eukprot:XP_001748003.1 hypothetical protein [Monosiga brevicollis MX1]